MNISNGKIVAIGGRSTPVLLQYRYLPYLNFISLADNEDENILYVTYETDSLIYIYDPDMNIVSAFGNAGRNMFQDYFEIKKRSDIRKHFFKEQKKSGYYDKIKYVHEKDLLFRSYHRGIASDDDGLQIYKGKTLIADLDVPKNLSVAGYIAPYFYSNAIIDEEKETIKVYKFQLRE